MLARNDDEGGVDDDDGDGGCRCSDQECRYTRCASGRREREREKAEVVARISALSVKPCFTIRPCHSPEVRGGRKKGERERSDQEPCFVVSLFFCSSHTNTHFPSHKLTTTSSLRGVSLFPWQVAEKWHSGKEFPISLRNLSNDINRSRLSSRTDSRVHR